MDTKIIGALHGAAARAKLEVAKRSAQRAGTRCVRKLQQAAGYVAGFAQGVLRPNA